MQSWVERLAWAVDCPTCRARAGEPCRQQYGLQDELDFNHPARNHAYHAVREDERHGTWGLPPAPLEGPSAPPRS